MKFGMMKPGILLMPDPSMMNVEQVTDEAPQVDEAPPNVDVIISRGVPTVPHEVRSATGRVIRVVQLVDKSAIFALPAPELRNRASAWTERPESGRVLVTDKEGKLLARFHEKEQALRHLKACNIDPKKLAGFEKPKPKVKPAEAKK